MEFDQFIKGNERMEKFIGKKIKILYNILLHKKPIGTLRDAHGDVKLLIYDDESTLNIMPYGDDYIAVFRIPDEVSNKLKIPSVLTTLIPHDVVNIKDPHDVIETFLASIQADLAEFFT